MRLGQTAVLLLLLQQTSACQELTCFADYIQNLECMWGGGLSPAHRALSNLTAKWDCGEGGSCSLSLTASNATHARYACFSEQNMCFATNTFEVSIATTLVGNPSWLPQNCRKTFLFQNHIKPHPPIHLAAAASPAGYNLSWETRYQGWEYPFLNGNLQHELRYKKKGRQWQPQRQKSLRQDQHSLQLLPQELEQDAEYEFQVRSEPAFAYQGTWSDWSPLASLKTTQQTLEHGGLQRWEVLLLMLSPVAALAVFLLRWHKRLCEKLYCFTPSPAPFFQPLYLSHNGDFKKWVGAPCFGTTLDALEWGIVVPEMFGIGHKRLLLSCAEGDWSDDQNGQPPLSDPLLPEPSQPSDTGCSATWEQGYGHLSIGTVTVVEEFATHCPHCSGAHPCGALEEPQEEAEASEEEAYRGLQLDHSSSTSPGLGSGLLLLGSEMALPGSWASHPSFGSPPGGPEEFFGLLPGPLILGPGLSAPGTEEGLFGQGPPSPNWDGDSDPVNGLDLDTMDSGFADCDCQSSGDGEAAAAPEGCSCQSEPGCEVGGPEKEDFPLPRYVKQWI